MLNRFQNSLEHSVCISKDVVVPETENAKATFLQVGITDLISPIFSVLTSIRFNDKHLFERHEVNDPGADGYLPTKFDASELPRTKKLPKLGFSVRRCVTKMTRAASFEFVDSIFRHFLLTRLAHFVRSAPSPTRGEGKKSRKCPVQKPGWGRAAGHTHRRGGIRGLIPFRASG